MSLHTEVGRDGQAVHHYMVFFYYMDTIDAKKPHEDIDSSK